MWILVALISPILYGAANIMDNYLANRVFRNIWTLLFFSSLCNLLFLPFVFLIDLPSAPTWSVVPYIFLVAIIDYLYIIPYYKSLQTEDTSIVSSLFSLGKIFVPVLAYFLLDEKLHPAQYLGFFIIIFCSAILTLHSRRKKLKLNKAFGYMIFSSLLFSLEAVIYKIMFESVSWATGFFWTTLASMFIFPFILLLPNQTRLIKKEFKKYRKFVPLFVLEELLTFGGTAGATLAISLIPVTLEKGIGSLQPFFTLLFGLFLSKVAPQLKNESLSPKAVFKKAVIFIIMILGVVLVANN